MHAILRTSSVLSIQPSASRFCKCTVNLGLGFSLGGPIIRRRHQVRLKNFFENAASKSHFGPNLKVSSQFPWRQVYFYGALKMLNTKKSRQFIRTSESKNYNSQHMIFFSSKSNTHNTITTMVDFFGQNYTLSSFPRLI